MAKRVVKAALWEYRDADGKKHRAFFGDRVELTEDEIERGERQGVFDPDAPVPTLDPIPALAGIEPRTPEPVLVGADSLPVPPHDVVTEVVLPPQEPAPVLEAINQPAVGGDQPEVVKTENVVEKPQAKRPAKAAHIDVWRKFIVDVTDITEAQAADMNKDQLQAAAPPED